MQYTIANVWKHDGKIAVPMYKGKPKEVFDTMYDAEKFIKTRCNGSKDHIAIPLDPDLQQEPNTIYGPSIRKYNQSGEVCETTGLK